MTKNKQDLPESVTIGASILFELRAQNVQLIDLRGIKDVTDYFLVATCESEAQMQARGCGIQGRRTLGSI